MSAYKIFAKNSNQVGKFSTTELGHILQPSYDLNVIQDSSYENGYINSTPTESMLTTLLYVISKATQELQNFTGHLYNSEVNYMEYSRVINSTDNLWYKSIQDNNKGNSLNDSNFWLKIPDPVENVGNLKRFTVNNANVDINGEANFITKVNNFNIKIDCTPEPLVYTYADGEMQKKNSNIIKSLNQNGDFLIYIDNFDIKFIPEKLLLRANTVNVHNTLYKPINQLQNGTVNFTNTSNTLNNIIGIDTSLLAVGQTITSSIIGLATGFLISCNRIIGSNILTNVNSNLWDSIFIGQIIIGTGIPANSRIIDFNNTGVISTSTITISANATSTGTQQPTISASPKIKSFTSTTITLDLPCIATTINSAIQIHEDIILSNSYFKAGMVISGTGIPANSIIQTIDDINNAIIINNNSTLTATAVNNIQTLQTPLFEQAIQPNGNENSLWIRPNPLNSYKKINGIWTIYNFVLLGKVIKSNGVIGVTTSYALNGEYDSIFATIASAGLKTANHNIGSIFLDSKILLKCVISEQGFSVGDILPITTTNTYIPNVISIMEKFTSLTYVWSFSDMPKPGANVVLNVNNWAYSFSIRRNF